MGDDRCRPVSPRAKTEPSSAPSSPLELDLKMATELEDDHKPQRAELVTSTTPIARQIPTPTPLDLSHREANEHVASKRPRASGVTLFPGLTITPGRGEDTLDEEEEDLPDTRRRNEEGGAPLTPSPTPSPPETSFPRFHFGRGGTRPGAGPNPCQKQLPSTNPSVTANGTSPSSTSDARQENPVRPRCPQELEGVGLDSWWYPGLVAGEVFRGLPDLPLPFPGLPAFRKYEK